MSSVEAAFSFAEELTKKESVERLMESLEILKFFVRDTIFVKLEPDSKRVIFIEQRPELKREADKTTLEDLLDRMDTITRTEAAILMNVNKRLVVEHMFLKILKKREKQWKQL
jgi:DNA polymerase III gamma/tau subunit